MGNHPINLAVRFILEVAALIVFGYWGWLTGEGWTSYVLAAGVPILGRPCLGHFRRA